MTGGVPDIGPASARRLIETCLNNSIFSVEQLRKMRMPVKTALPCIWFCGMLAVEKEQQLSFITEFSDVASLTPKLAGVLG